MNSDQLLSRSVGSGKAALVLLFLAWAGLPGTVYPAIPTGPTGLTGINVANPGDEVAIYSVEIARDPPTQEALLRIRIVIEDLSISTGIASTDFTELRMYESINAVLDGGDTQIGTVASGSINIGAETDIPAGAALLPAGGARFYLITAVISPTAVGGRMFKLGANNLNIDIDQDPPGPPVGFDGITDQQLNGPVGASDNNRVEIAGGGAGGTAGGAMVAVPFEGEWLLLVAIAGLGLYYLRPNRR
ncbi:MAG: hypothetical protein HYW07_19540 [Candidatus Latescibacteria bacterium]|nr:hypothetical protein [Candidatus Latescibacterota bacterium]